MKEQSLKQKTVGALLWNLLDRMGQQVLLFIVGIIVANILSVEDYALVGMLAIFSAVANIVLDSGFSAALIQKKETTERDFSSVFWFNLGISILLYLLLVSVSPFIARFFSQPKLTKLAAVVFLALPINSLAIIQTTIFTKEVRFKVLAKVNLLSMTFSGIASLAMAYAGFGVWTLALQPVILALARTLLLWLQSSWRPQRVFSFSSIRVLFRFASSLLLASLINTCFLNIYSVIIGKLYPIRQLGYYTQGSKMCDMGVSMLYGSIQNATYPIFSSIQDEKDRLIRAYRKTIRFTAFITFPVLAGLVVIARPLIELLLKEEWWPAIPFFQLLCAGGCFTILTAINNNFIKVSGRSDGILKLEYFKIVITVIILALTYNRPVLVMVVGLVVARAIIYFINMIYTARFTGYGVMMQCRDLLPYLFLSGVMAVVLLPMGHYITGNGLLISVQIVTGGIVYVVLTYVTGSRILKESIELLLKNRRRR
ncbi:lipopolysaccharide biosynthesis protein [uncultured Bacteroides sp.]|uniref:lipopolysaccharide biosynthesis protein n=1 Tax=uncultured Bacteroides sp. TaxID=162156 RepID=UPI002AA5E2D7|nr:lipopolysaccharide biosynthesis protein [uncultured Bacteroides sp.]